MKNNKICIILATIAGIVFGNFCAGKTDFQKKLAKSIKVDTSKYLANIDCVDTVSEKPKRG